MSSAASPFRLPRLQFSLRAILLVMLIVGIGLMVYRWPWEVKSELPDGTPIKTQYRRSWNGRAVKHGRETMLAPPQFGWENWYDEGDIRFQRSWSDGVVNGEAHFRDGKKHGQYWHNSPEWGKIRGEYRHDKKHGNWSHELYDLIRCERLHDDQLLRIDWKTKTGEVLQSMELENGAVREWNDLPLPVALDQWLHKYSVLPHVRQFMLTRIDDASELRIRKTEHHELEFQFGEQELLVVWPDLSKDLEKKLSTGKVFGEVLADEALTREQTLTYRYNTLCVVPIRPHSFAWTDCTGVYDVKFPADSAQEKLWLQPMTPIPHWALTPAGRIRQMLYVGDTPVIEVEVPDRFETEDNDLTDTVSTQRMPRSRCDLLGQYLNDAGCYVQREENKLVIKNQSDRPQGN